MLKKRLLVILILLAGITLVLTMTGCGGSGAGGGGGGGTITNLPALTGTVSITGTAKVGETLTANTDALGGSGAITYQWRRGTANTGTDSNTYVIQTADIGSTITVRVSRSGYSGSVTSEPTAAVTGETNGNGEVKITIPGSTVELTMVKIEGGTFRMGSPDTEPDRWTNENPRTANSGNVTISGFYMGKYPVTQAQYEAVMGNNPSAFTGDNRPVERVTWFDAIEFCNKLSELQGLTPVYTITDRTPTSGHPITSATVTANWSATGYRLPTEAQWEYACRAETTTAFNWGTNQITSDQANFRANSSPYNDSPLGISREETTDVGTFSANAFGLYDKHGNVWEWCWDWYTASYDDAGGYNNPTGPDSGADRVIRGGSWSDYGQILRSAFRFRSYPSYRDDFLGFRLARPGN